MPCRKTERKAHFTSNNPCFLLREFPSRVQKYRCDFPQVTMILVSVGWKSAANTASFEHFKKKEHRQRIKCHRPRAGYWVSQAPLTSLCTVILAVASFPLCLRPYGWEHPESAQKAVLQLAEQGDVTLGGDIDVPLPSLSPVTGISREDPGLHMAYGCLILAHCGCRDSPGVPQFGVS